jgi:signal transduction histidine kinase
VAFAVAARGLIGSRSLADAMPRSLADAVPRPNLRPLLVPFLLLAGSIAAFVLGASLAAERVALDSAGTVMVTLAGVAFLGRLRVHLRSRERRATARALAQERRRMAADVHDLIMQDLAFALAHARALAEDPAQSPRAGTVVAAGERALAAARQVVDGLANRDSQPIVQSVESATRAAARHARLSFDADGVPASMQPDRPTRDALVHIAREAVTNATKHADANTIDVVLEYVDEWRLRVRDQGCGFDAARVGGGFGLESMRAHALALGGSLQVRSAAREGTTVEAVLP